MIIPTRGILVNVVEVRVITFVAMVVVTVVDISLVLYKVTAVTEFISPMVMVSDVDIWGILMSLATVPTTSSPIWVNDLSAKIFHQ